jgi:dihydroxyacid dehydratase/phosphogluconate dehydratase
VNSAKKVGQGAGRGRQERPQAARHRHPKSIENAVAVIMATGGSTNAVLHFLAIAHAAGVEWTIDDFERVRRAPRCCAT